MRLLNFILGTAALISSVTASPAAYTKDRCGGSNGKCDGNECCSQYNWCGTSNDHCLLSRGCQSSFGKCIDDINITPVPTTDGNVKWAGFRFSEYGVKDSYGSLPSASTFVSNVNKIKNRFYSETKGAIILIVGEASGEEHCRFGFPKPSNVNSSLKVKFTSKDLFEDYLKAFDNNNIDVWLQVEPGNNDPVDLAKIVFNRYGSHKSVKGFGIDLEWWYRGSNGKGSKLSDEWAKYIVSNVRQINSSYTVFAKHWEPEFMPPTYRDHMIFVDDSQGFSGKLNKMTNEFGVWAQKFKNNPVFFQIGYDDDKSIWQKDPISVAKAVADAASKYNKQVGIIWVDFTMKQALSKM